MDVIEKTAAQWQEAIDGLIARAATYDNEAAALSAEASALALDAELQVTGAAERLKSARAEAAKKRMAADNLRQAIEGARHRMEDARVAEAAQAEAERRRQIAAALAEYAAVVRQIDAALELAALRFGEGKMILDRAEDLMQPAERTAVQGLRTTFGATLAAANAGLGDYIQLGPLAAHHAHRKSLTAYAGSFVEGWVKPTDGKE